MPWERRGSGGILNLLWSPTPRLQKDSRIWRWPERRLSFQLQLHAEAVKPSKLVGLRPTLYAPSRLAPEKKESQGAQAQSSNPYARRFAREGSMHNLDRF
ncbi:uncharacterized protein CIMG_11968 [Coccidioides immitis RS]|uniref:Uncharacterized protein n=4 Tax=Coccidioides immitis TaxID=5501 RepID=A0A0D8JUG6_COCIM|nr:uncharacterized protein CIMG_11968 [Coccidioides immitis RS]KJF60932.1 hypothetical protein CIMG_11968 [Coccidioides immitis RS]KMP05876.1 hypothetical protein CIRG_05558 [Coccidioides immitis RMSCC 2394]KMU80692.1 hypothetical protein CISG_08756 [Coccidioides immitis RMSCC 3703]KMU91451.1 hypothetical protein CIHG_09321 [Coccidioides immitis H538.4]